MQKLNDLLGVENGSENATEKERLERLRKDCEFFCERENKKQGNLNEYDGYNCKACNNKGYYLKPKLYLNSYSQVRVTCKCEKVRKAIRALKRSGLSDVVQEYTLDKYIVTDDWQKVVLDKAKLYLTDKEKGWFYIGGQTGSGKTHICTAIAVSLLKQDNEVKYMLWNEEAKKLKSLANDIGYQDEISVYKDVDVLYIDDLFKTGKTDKNSKPSPTQADINLAFEILNYRANQKKITIISSECTLTDLIGIDEATAGRIKQKSGDYCLNIGYDIKKNYRLKKTNDISERKDKKQ